MKRYSNALLAAVVAAFVSIATMIVLLPFGGSASQNNQYLPTTGVFNGLTAANTLNNAIASLNTCNSGSSAPTNALGGAAVEGMCWLDTTSSTLKVLKRYTGSAWVVEGVLDVTNSRWSPPIGGGTATVNSAATTDLCASPQAVQTINNTTTITSFGSNCVVGIRKTLIFAGILTLTHNSTSLILPGAFSRTTAVGDVAEAVYLGSGNWRVVSYVTIANVVRTVTKQVFTAGASGTYTTPAGTTRIEIHMVGGGGGGGGGGNSTAATAGGNTCWNASGAACTSPVYQAGGGTAGVGANGVSAGVPPAGGTVSGSGTCDWSVAGGSGTAGLGLSTSNNVAGGPGGNSTLGGAGGGSAAGGAGASAAANSGSGGGGGGINATSSAAGSGGGAGATCHVIINSPAATYTYAVAGTAAGASGTGGGAGGTGAGGQIIIYEH